MDHRNLLRCFLPVAVLLAGLTAGCQRASDTAVDHEALKRELEELKKQRREDEKPVKSK
jgi:hypothetical protein